MTDGASVRIAWGPFPVAWGWVVWFLVLLTLGGGLLRASAPRRLACARATPRAAVVCDLEGPFGEATRHAVAGVRAQLGSRSNKGHVTTFGVLTLEDGAGRAEAAWEESVEAAQAQVAELVRFLAAPAERAVDVVRARDPGFAVGGGLFLLVGLAGLAVVLRHAGRYRFTWDAAHRVLTRQRLVFGVTLGPRRFSLADGVQDVAVVFREPASVASQGGGAVATGAAGPDGVRVAGAVRPAGQLRVFAGGREVRLAEAFLPGVNLHLRAAEGLRGLLGCHDPARPGAAGPDDRVAQARRREAAVHGTLVADIEAGRASMRVGMAWVGLCVGALLAVFPALLLAGAAGGEVHVAAVACLVAGAATGLFVSLTLTRSGRPIP